MDLSHLTAADGVQIEAFVHGKLLAQRATKTTDSERRQLDETPLWMETVVVDKNDPGQLTFDERAMQVAAPTRPATAP